MTVPATTETTPARPLDFSNIGTNLVRNLKLHPLNAEVYGDSEPDSALIESIRKHGILNPIIIDRQKRILSGTRRYLAARHLGLKSVSVVTLLNGTWSREKELSAKDELRGELLLIESNRARVKTEAQKDAEAAHLLRIESELARQRMTLGKILPTPETGKAVEKVAAATGESAETIRKRVEIHAAGVPAEIRNGQSVHAAHQNLPKPTKCKFCDEVFESKGKALKHQKKSHPAQLYLAGQNELLEEHRNGSFQQRTREITNVGAADSSSKVEVETEQQPQLEIPKTFTQEEVIPRFEKLVDTLAKSLIRYQTKRGLNTRDNILQTQQDIRNLLKRVADLFADDEFEAVDKTTEDGSR